MKIKNHIWLALLPPALFAAACQPPGSTTVTTNVANTNSAPANNSTEIANQPLIEAAPIEAGDEGYKIITGDDFKLTVRAAGASEVAVFYQPVTAVDRALKLKTLTAPSDNSNEYVADLKIPEDFNGEVWAQVKYKNGDFKETEHLLMAKRGATENAAVNEQAQANPNANNATNSNNTANSNSNAANQNGDSEESARSDKLTNGKIERATLKAGDGNVHITVNVPAFTMTLWQGDKEIKSYYVGVGRKNFPIPIGMRSADKIILNPNWIPPDSEWVRKSDKIEPYEKIAADDPLNPLGKIKIPLGDAYLLHEADSPSDIGNLVSHGCVRVMRDDMFEITEMISEARNLAVTKQEIEAARKNSDRKVISLNGEIPVDINYDSLIVEKGVLTIYPDVYERNTNTIEKLRAKLESCQVDVLKLDDKTLEAMLGKVNGDEKFTVPLADLKAGKKRREKTERINYYVRQKTGRLVKKHLPFTDLKRQTNH